MARLDLAGHVDSVGGQAVGAIGAREAWAALRVLRRGELGRYAVPGTSESDRLESDLQHMLGAGAALAVNSGTSALVTALAAAGVGPGDEVLVPAYTWVSTAAAALLVGAVPVLVEVDESLTMDPTDLLAKITPASRAVIPVHMMNLVADLTAIQAVADQHGLVLVEDACQAVGVRYRGRRVGTIGAAGAFSFSSTKNITAGEGGAVVTNDPVLAGRARELADVGSYTRRGWTEGVQPPLLGSNYKINELSSAVLRPQLARLDAQLDRRRRRRAAMVEELAANPGIRIAPHHDPDDAVGLAITVDDPELVARIAGRRGARRLLDTSRHVYTNWESVLGGRTHHPAFAPAQWAGRPEGSVHATSAPATLDVLGRSLSVTVRPDLPVAVNRYLARSLAAA